MNRWINLACLVSLLLACETPKSEPQIAFYHWQTHLKIQPNERSFIAQTNSQRLYVKFFDLKVVNQEVIPVAKLQVDTNGATDLDIVPTIFITNASMRNLGKQQSNGAIDTLVARSKLLIGQLWPGLVYREIQFDCDWTSQTRTTFFTFLETWRQALPQDISISSTLRLHQYRYPGQTGIPPVDRVMLMYYNMGELDDWNEQNSILNLPQAASYLNASSYPLPIDLALPLFSWGVLFREGKVLKLITNLNANRLVDTSFFEPLIAENEILGAPYTSLNAPPDSRDLNQSAGKRTRFMVKKSTYLDGYYLYAGDLLRLEEIDSNLLIAAAQQWHRNGKQRPAYLTFYHLDEAVLKAFTHQNLRDCAQVWLTD